MFEKLPVQSKSLPLLLKNQLLHFPR